MFYKYSLKKLFTPSHIRHIFRAGLFIIKEQGGGERMGDEVFIIYADILLLINFVLDFLCLFISGKLLSKRFRTFRILAASLFGAAYSLVYYILYPLEWFLLMPLHIAAACVICLIAYRMFSVKDTAKTVAVFILTSALLG